MDNIRICFVSTSKQMTLHVMHAVETYTKAMHVTTDVHYVQSALDDAVEPTKRACRKFDCEAVISLRGTASMLATEVDIPVIGIPMSTTLLLRGIRPIVTETNADQRIVVTLYETQQIDIDLIRETFDVDIRVVRYKNRSDLEKGLFLAAEDGYRTLFGGGATNRIGGRFGMRTHLIIPSASQVALAFENAGNVVRVNRNERLEKARNLQIVNAVDEGIISTDANGRIQMMNDKARQQLHLSEKSVGKPFIDVFPQATLQHVAKSGRDVMAKMLDVDGKRYVVNQKAIIIDGRSIGAVATISPVERIIRTAKIAQKAIAHGLVARYDLCDFKYVDPMMEKVVRKAERYAATDSSILLTGETGTGKEILAHGIHMASARRNGPFVSVNCSALPASLLESELFGYEAGAFTGGNREGKAGLFELADTGTIFLDEINSMPINVQNVLLRVLQGKEVRRVGGHDLLKVDVRVIAASNKNPIDEIRAGHMREDLYFRLNVLTVEIPPLRRHRGDVPFLVRHFLGGMRTKGHAGQIDLPDDCMERLEALPWPGNTREVQHFAERLAILTPPSGFDRDVFEELYEEARAASRRLRIDDPAPSVASSKTDAKSSNPPLTKESVLDALHRAEGHRGRAASLLGIGRTTLWRAMAKYGLEQEQD